MILMSVARCIADDMTILTTERLRLAPFDDAHVDGLNAINSDPEVMRYLGSPESRKETLEVIQRVKGRWIEYGFSWWSFIEHASDQIVGAGCTSIFAEAENPRTPHARWKWVGVCGATGGTRGWQPRRPLRWLTSPFRR
jgi:RimJ/RimL family protein N-acetyltransferase